MVTVKGLLHSLYRSEEQGGQGVRSNVILRIRYVDNPEAVQRALAILQKGRNRALQRVLSDHSPVTMPLAPEDQRTGGQGN